MCVDLFSNHNSYTTVIEKELDAIQEINVNEYMEILPKEYINYTLETNKNYNKYDDMVLDCEDKLWQENRSNKKSMEQILRLFMKYRVRCFIKTTRTSLS